jgi:hypothetical protein
MIEKAIASLCLKVMTLCRSFVSGSRALPRPLYAPDPGDCGCDTFSLYPPRAVKDSQNRFFHRNVMIVSGGNVRKKKHPQRIFIISFRRGVM